MQNQGSTQDQCVLPATSKWVLISEYFQILQIKTFHKTLSENDRVRNHIAKAIEKQQII